MGTFFFFFKAFQNHQPGLHFCPLTRQILPRPARIPTSHTGRQAGSCTSERCENESLSLAAPVPASERVPPRMVWHGMARPYTIPHSPLGHRRPRRPSPTKPCPAPYRTAPPRRRPPTCRGADDLPAPQRASHEHGSSHGAEGGDGGEGAGPPTLRPRQAGAQDGGRALPLSAAGGAGSGAALGGSAVRLGLLGLRVRR